METVSHAIENIHKDKLCKILLDKGDILPPIGRASDEQYWIKKPTEGEYLACCNDFWWCSNNIAKGLWRNEIPYVQDMTNYVVRKQLERMLCWKIGILENYSVSVGKSAKYMYRWLSEDEYNRYLSTYFGGNVSEAWEAISIMCNLFEDVACWVAEQLGYVYNLEEGKAAREFLEHIKYLPKDASDIY